MNVIDYEKEYLNKLNLDIFTNEDGFRDISIIYGKRFVALRDMEEDKKFELKPHHLAMGYKKVNEIYKKICKLHYSVPMTEENTMPDGKKFMGWSDKEFDLVQIYHHAEAYWETVMYMMKKDAEKNGELNVWMNVENKDIIITDPCYIFDTDKKDYYDEDLKGMIWKSNHYGDWSCTMFEENLTTGEKKPVGQFCADAGAVCVATTDAECINLEKLNKLGEWCYTRINNFTGKVSIEFVPSWNDYHVVIDGDIYGERVKFVSCQTGM